MRSLSHILQANGVATTTSPPCHTVTNGPKVNNNIDGTRETPFVHLIDRRILSSGVYRTEIYQTIGFQTPYQNHSFEELRLLDYAKEGRVEYVGESSTTNHTQNSLGSIPGSNTPTTASASSTPIETLPEELLSSVVEFLSLSDSKSLRLTSSTLARSSIYTFARRFMTYIELQLTESGLRKFLPISQNHDLCRSLQALVLDGHIIPPNYDTPITDHNCNTDPLVLDCPVRVHEQLLNGLSELHTSLLQELLDNLSRQLDFIHLTIFPIAVNSQDTDYEPRAWYPMTSWPIRSVVAAVAASSTLVEELIVNELKLTDWHPNIRDREPLLLPPLTDTSSALFWPCMPFLRSLNLRVQSSPKLRHALPHPSLFRHMRSFLQAAAPGLETLAIRAGRAIHREMVEGLLGKGMELPRLKTLQLHEARVMFNTMMPFLVAHAGTLRRLELVICQLDMKTTEAREMGDFMERDGMEVVAFDCFPPHLGRRLEKRCNGCGGVQ